MNISTNGLMVGDIVRCINPKKPRIAVVTSADRCYIGLDGETTTYWDGHYRRANPAEIELIELETPKTDEFQHDMWETSFFPVDRLSHRDAEILRENINWVFDNLARPLERENVKLRELLINAKPLS